MDILVERPILTRIEAADITPEAAFYGQMLVIMRDEARRARSSAGKPLDEWTDDEIMAHISR